MNVPSTGTGGRTSRVLVGLGSNRGARADHLRAGIRLLAELPGVALRALSGVYETAPVGGPPQGAYLNAVAAIDTSLEPLVLLARMQGIELARGRTRGRLSNLPRTLDLDVLLWEERRIESADLVVPHPRLHQRAFVLTPLVELAPDDVHPVSGRRIHELFAELPDDRGVRRYPRSLFGEEELAELLGAR